MQKSEKNTRREEFGHIPVPSPKNMLQDHINQCMNLLERMGGTEPMTDRERKLLKVATLPFIEDLLDEAVYFVMRGHGGEFNHNLDTVKAVCHNLF